MTRLTPTWQIAHLNLRLYAALVRTEGATKAVHTCRLSPKTHLNADPPIADWFKVGVTPDRLKEEDLHDHLMLLRVAGAYTMVDRVTLSRISADLASLDLEVLITKVESADGEPAEAEMFLLLPLNETITQRENLRLRFSAQYRSFDGNVTPLSSEPDDFVLSWVPRHKDNVDQH